MDDYSKITTSEMLTQLLDGELEHGANQFFYDKLAQDEDLQSEMHDHIAIRETVRRDTEAFAPPAELSKSVFSKLGFVSPMTPPPPKRSYALRFSVLALLLLFVTTFIAYQSGIIFNYESTAVASSQIEENQALAEQTSASIDIPVVKTQANNSASKLNNIGAKVAKNKNANLPANIANTTSVENFATNDISEQTITNYALLSNSQQVFMNNDLQGFSADKSKMFSASFDFSRNIRNQQFIDNSSGYFKRAKSINLRGSYSLSADERALQNGVAGSFALGAYINSGIRNLSIGAEIGREPYSQIFLSESGDYEQNPEIMWLGLALKYDFKELDLAGFVPFSQVVAGASELGPMGRVYLGASRAIYGSIGFNVGVEGSMLVYKNMNKYYSTNKIGISGGLVYSF